MVDIESFIYFFIGIDPGVTRTGMSICGLTEEGKMVLIDFYHFAEPTKNKKYSQSIRAFLMAETILDKINTLLEKYIMPIGTQSAVIIEGAYPGSGKKGAHMLPRLIQAVYTMYNMLYQSDVPIVEYQPDDIKIKLCGRINGKTPSKEIAQAKILEILQMEPTTKERLEKQIDKGQEAILDSAVANYAHLVTISGEE